MRSRHTGEVEQARRVSGQDNAERLLLKLKAIEGGPVIADLGDASKLQGLDFKTRDYIHVRGNMTESGGKQVLLAQELIAEGKVFTISRDGLRDTAADIGVFGEHTSEEPATPKSPAARAPSGEKGSSPPSH